MDIQQFLANAAAGLWMPSESEYPFQALAWEQDDWDALEAMILAQVAQPAPLETISLEHLFRNVAFPKDWHDDTQQANVVKFQKLMAALNTVLTDLRVYRIGAIEIDVYILGKFAGGIAGLHTKLVET